MLTCSKLYADIPFAHRQHCHDGHCSLIHGHNWSIRFTFGADQPDENGFVVDFGRLKFIREYLAKHVDHACVFNEDDPLRDQIVASVPGVYKPYIVDSCSCEGLARHFWGIFDPMVRSFTNNRARVIAVEVFEDSRNSAEYRP